MKNRYNAILLLFLCFFIQGIKAQEVETNQTELSNFSQFFKVNTDYQLRAQFSIGGSSPMGLPTQIREIVSYNPTLQLGLEANATKWFNDDQKWGLRVGLRFEGRGMKTEARVKNYHTQLIAEEGKQTEGFFTGNVNTKMKNTYVTFPVLMTWNVTKSWNAYGGFYFSGLMERDFTGYVHDGVLREGSPIGDPIVFEGDAKGEYDFSDDLNRFQYGLQLGGEYKMNSNFRLFVDLNWGLSGLFKSDFQAISFSMYSIYANLGFGYNF